MSACCRYLSTMPARGNAGTRRARTEHEIGSPAIAQVRQHGTGSTIHQKAFWLRSTIQPTITRPCAIRTCTSMPRMRPGSPRTCTKFMSYGKPRLTFCACSLTSVTWNTTTRKTWGGCICAVPIFLGGCAWRGATKRSCCQPSSTLVRQNKASAIARSRKEWPARPPASCASWG